MSAFETLQGAEAYVSGRALPAAMVAHRRLPADPMTICLYSLGAEPFSAAAVQWGRSRTASERRVAGDPRNRDLAFAALEPFAEAFNAYFETPWAARTTRTTPRGREVTELPWLPQVLVPNRETVLLAGRIGRRLRFVANAPKALVRLGAHLAFLRDHAAHYGQQLIVAATDIVDLHWHLPLSDWERASLAAQHACIEPPPGKAGHEAAAEVDVIPLGPRPDASQDARLAPLLETFQRRRAGATDRATVTPLLAPIDAHYEELLAPAWELAWATLERERRLPEARFVERRVADDADAYTRHMWLVDRGVRRRTRQTISQTIALRSAWEDAATRVAAEEAYDDPLKMVELLLDGQAFIGIVAAVDAGHRVQGPVRFVRRPRVVVDLEDTCPLLAGDTVPWDRDPDHDYLIDEVRIRPGRGDRVVVLLQNPGAPVLPQAGGEFCAASSSIEKRWRGSSAAEDPWPYRGAEPAAPEDIDGEEAA
jgi:hypothetical protein